MIRWILITGLIVLLLMIVVLLVTLGEDVYKAIKRKQRDKEWEREQTQNRIRDLEHRLDCHSETVGQMNWKLSEMEEKLNEKKNNRTKRNK